MTAPCRLLIYQMAVNAGEPAENRQRLRDWVRRISEVTPAFADGPTMVCLPELWNTGYLLEKVAETADGPQRRSRKALRHVARQLGAWVVGGSVAERDEEGGIANRTVIVRPDGTEAATYDKIHRFSPSGEDRYFKAGEDAVTVAVSGPGGERKPGAGTGYQAGTIICYDLRFGHLVQRLADSGISLLFVPAHWPQVRRDHWRLLLQARAVEHQIYVVGCNAVANVEGLIFSGDSMVVDPWGRLLAEAGDREETLDLVIDLALVQEVRRRLPVRRDRTCLPPAKE